MLAIPSHLTTALASESWVDSLQRQGFVIVSGGLARDEYAKMLRSSRVVVLAYGQEFYRWGSSGKMLDAVRSGARVVVPSDCAMAGDVADGDWGSTYHPGSSSSLLRALSSELSFSAPRESVRAVPGVEDFTDWILDITGNSDECVKPARPKRGSLWHLGRQIRKFRVNESNE